MKKTFEVIKTVLTWLIVLLALLWFVTRLAGRSFAAEVRKR